MTSFDRRCILSVALPSDANDGISDAREFRALSAFSDGVRILGQSKSHDASIHIVILFLSLTVARIKAASSIQSLRSEAAGGFWMVSNASARWLEQNAAE